MRVSPLWLVPLGLAGLIGAGVYAICGVDSDPRQRPEAGHPVGNRQAHGEVAQPGAQVPNSEALKVAAAAIEAAGKGETPQHDEPPVMPALLGPAHERALAGNWDVARARRRIRDDLQREMRACIRPERATKLQIEVLVGVSWRPEEVEVGLLSHEIVDGGPAKISDHCLDGRLRQGLVVSLPDKLEPGVTGLHETRETFRLFLSFDSTQIPKG